jgi:nucleotide-binding universal stress UspA family protein
MYEKIIVPLDGSENSEKVLPYIEELAKRTHCELIFLGVCSEHERSFEYLFKKHIQDLAVQFNNKGLKSRSVFLYGSPSEEIIKYADDNDASLIAMATHGRSGFKEWVLGGVSEKILVHSSKPILFISPKGEGDKAAKGTSLQKILVPLDGSELGAVTLPWAKELCKSTNGKLFLLHIIVSPSKTVGMMYYAAGFEKQLAETLREQSQEYIGGIVAELEKETLDSKFDLIEGVPSEEILNYARKNSIELIAMSTHGMTGFSRVVLGSVVHQVIHKSDIPVLVVPAKAKNVQ